MRSRPPGRSTRPSASNTSGRRCIWCSDWITSAESTDARRQAIGKLGRGHPQDLDIADTVRLASLPEHALHVGHRLDGRHGVGPARDQAREVPAAGAKLERAAVAAARPDILHQLLRRILVVLRLGVPVGRIVRGGAAARVHPDVAREVDPVELSPELRGQERHLGRLRQHDVQQEAPRTCLHRPRPLPQAPVEVGQGQRGRQAEPPERAAHEAEGRQEGFGECGSARCREKTANRIRPLR